MNELKCPFSVIQASGFCHCEQAQEVIRRGGAEYICKSPDANALCVALKDHLNEVALPALGYEDDLTSTPRSVYERIMIGGLHGLRRAMGVDDDALETSNIWLVVESASQNYSSMDAIPDDHFVPAIEACKLKKRRRKSRE